MTRAIEYIVVTLIGLALAGYVAHAAASYVSAQFERGTAAFEVAK